MKLIINKFRVCNIPLQLFITTLKKSEKIIAAYFHFICTIISHMKISGFTIIRNAVLNDYPILEAIGSILPVVDEMIVLIGNSDDETEQLIQSINDPKIKIHHSVWDDSLRKGAVYSRLKQTRRFN